MTTNRVPRKDFIVARCMRSCPAGVDVPRYIRAVRMGKFDEAVAVIREKIPFPFVCADACFAPCEDACAYKQFGDPIAIRALKRVAVDRAGDGWKKSKKKSPATNKKVAIIGAGPTGLTASYYLATLGHQVTLMDEFPKPGGMMRYAIPKYRLPEERLDRDIKDIFDTGIVFRSGVSVGKDVDMGQLIQDFDAVIIASGAQTSARVPLEGADKEGFWWGLEFLREAAFGNPVDIGERVVVIGGGNVAIDVALTAGRLGAKEVNLFCLETRDDMPAHPWEIALAEEEGVFIHNAWAPKKVLGETKVTGLGLKRCVSVFDGACNFNPVYDEEITHRIPADTVIAAIGQAPALDFLSSQDGIKIQGNRLAVSDGDLSVGLPGVFAAGEVVTGPASIIAAIAEGRKLAENVDRYLGGAGDISEMLASPEDEVLINDRAPIRPRQQTPRLEVWERMGNLDQVEKGFMDQQAALESSRCLDCDARQFEVVVNTAHCKECGYCKQVCSMDVFGPAKDFNAKGYKPMECKSSEWCVGCLKCFFACPDFAIDIRTTTA
jgi:formate dehydrogenase (NADP+) beta subunit